jgi:titin
MSQVCVSSIYCVPSAVPDPPENLRWRDKSASGIFLTWEPPKYDGGTGIKGYNVERCQRGTDKWEPCGDMVPELKYVLNTPNIK